VVRIRPLCKGFPHRSAICLIFEWYVELVFALPAAPASAAVRPAALTVVVRSFPIRCGHVVGSMQVVFPPAFELPTAIGAGAVRLNGVTAGRVTVAGHIVVVTAPTVHGVTCQVIVAVRLTLVFTKAADIGAAPGRYVAAVRYGVRTYRAAVKVSA